MDSRLLKFSIIEAIKNTADRKTIDLNQLQSDQQLPDQYHIDELANSGTWYCDHCRARVEPIRLGLLEAYHHCG